MEASSKRGSRYVRGTLKRDAHGRAVLDAFGKKTYEPVKPKAQLSDVEVAVLLALLRYPLLRAKWILALVGRKCRTYLLLVLKYLYSAGLVDHAEGNTPRSLVHPLTFRLSEKGLKELRRLNLTDRNKLDNISQFAHQLATSEVMADIEIEVRKHPHLRLLSKEDLLSRAPQATRDSKYPFSIPVDISYGKMHEHTHYVADGWFGIEYTESKSVRWFALEINHGSNVRANNLTDASHLKKFLCLIALRAQHPTKTSATFQSHFGIKAPVIGLFVQADRSVTENSKGLLGELTAGKGNRSIVFKTIPAFYSPEHPSQPEGRTLTEAWERVGHEPFRMDQP